MNEYTELTWGQIPYVPTHDAAGNLTMDPWAPNVGFAAAASQWYEYDEENRVTAVRKPDGPDEDSDPDLVAQYEYDALGRRVLTTEYIDATTGATLTTPKVTRHVYVGIETIEEYDVTGITSGSGTLLREFLWGDPGRFPEPVAMVSHDGTGNCVPFGEPDAPCVFHYLHDALGSVVGLTDEAGAMVERYTYDPYGRTFVERWDASANEGAGGWVPNIVGGATGSYSPICYSAFGNPFLWTGQRYDASTGLYAFLFRTYSPSLGRWLQRDPIGYLGGSINLYEYVISNPLVWDDPLGLKIPCTPPPPPPPPGGGGAGGPTTCPAPKPDPVMELLQSLAEAAGCGSLKCENGYVAWGDDHKARTMSSDHNSKGAGGAEACRTLNSLINSSWEVKIEIVDVKMPNTRVVDEKNKLMVIQLCSKLDFFDPFFDTTTPIEWEIILAHELYHAWLFSEGWFTILYQSGPYKGQPVYGDRDNRSGGYYHDQSTLGFENRLRLLFGRRYMREEHGDIGGGKIGGGARPTSLKQPAV